MKHLHLILLIVAVIFAPQAKGQHGFNISGGKSDVEIPFEYESNFIIITFTFHGVLPLRFIFDTGAEYTILSKKEIADVLDLRFDREFKIIGSDMKTEIVAYLARGIRFEIHDKIIAPREDILILKEDYFRFEEYSGVRVHGILSGTFFSRFIFKINYQRKVIELIDREKFKLREPGFQEIPVEYYRGKLYLNTQLEIMPDSVAPVKLLLDTGAALPLLLFTKTHPLLLPPPNAIPGNIGMGLGGYLDGFHGRVHRLKIGDFEQNAIVSEFQAADSLEDRQHLNNRNGLIGNVILSRFQVIFDYHEEKIWLKPNKSYRKAFSHDRSGLSIYVSGLNLSTFTVQNVVPGSPAAEAGILPGDRIKRLGYVPAGFFSLQSMYKRLAGKPGKKIRLSIQRDGKKMRKELVLRDLI